MARRYGIPKTEAERMATHYAKYGTTELPPRGYGLEPEELAGWVVSEVCNVSPTSVGIGETIEIRGRFKNTWWLPASAKTQFFFDGATIDEHDWVFWPGETAWDATTYEIPPGTPEGRHECAVKEWAESWDERKTAPLTVVIPPPPDKCKFIVTTIPAGANAHINEAYIGTTPTIFELDEGYYDLLLTLTGYKDKTDRIHAVPGNVYELNYTLTPVEEAEIPWPLVLGGVGALALGYVVLEKKK